MILLCCGCWVGWLSTGGGVEGKANKGSTRLAITASSDKHKNTMFPIYVESKHILTTLLPRLEPSEC